MLFNILLKHLGEQKHFYLAMLVAKAEVVREQMETATFTKHGTQTQYCHTNVQLFKSASQQELVRSKSHITPVDTQQHDHRVEMFSNSH